MSEVHRYSVVKMLSEARNKISYDPHGPEVVMAKDYDALAAKLAMAEDAAAKLAAFAQEIISGALEGGSFDGAELQESAERHGLIAKQVMREPCRGPEEYCACAWSTSFPTECYRITAELRALLNQDKENGNG